MRIEEPCRGRERVVCVSAGAKAEPEASAVKATTERSMMNGCLALFLGPSYYIGARLPYALPHSTNSRYAHTPTRISLSEVLEK